MQEGSDEQLMTAVMAGDQAALAALVTRHHAPLLGYLYRLVGGDRPLAEDLVQETLLHVLRQRTCQADRPFKPWLYAIATNLARDYFKSAAVRQRWRSGDEEQALLQLYDSAADLGLCLGTLPGGAGSDLADSRRTAGTSQQCFSSAGLWLPAVRLCFDWPVDPMVSGRASDSVPISLCIVPGYPDICQQTCHPCRTRVNPVE